MAVRLPSAEHGDRWEVVGRLRGFAWSPGLATRGSERSVLVCCWDFKSKRSYCGRIDALSLSLVELSLAGLA